MGNLGIAVVDKSDLLIDGKLAIAKSFLIDAFLFGTLQPNNCCPQPKGCCSTEQITPNLFKPLPLFPQPGLLNTNPLFPQLGSPLPPLAGLSSSSSLSSCCCCPSPSPVNPPLFPPLLPPMSSLFPPLQSNNLCCTQSSNQLQSMCCPSNPLTLPLFPRPTVPRPYINGPMPPAPPLVLPQPRPQPQIIYSHPPSTKPLGEGLIVPVMLPSTSPTSSPLSSGYDTEIEDLVSSSDNKDSFQSSDGYSSVNDNNSDNGQSESEYFPTVHSNVDASDLSTYSPSSKEFDSKLERKESARYNLDDYNRYDKIADDVQNQCNNQRLKAILNKWMVASDVEHSQKVIQKAITRYFDRYLLVCSPHPLNISLTMPSFCAHSLDNVFCYLSAA
ncbi:unnamed protein product [Anisakis simplex]|uniref:Leucine-rich repeat extensin-like protein 2 n=1 Tax=Anisakis simplex TaxID=6269 RepID=A0A0M3K9F3_ANISI|nr:unnamed protein product [Anisakis simplex]